MKSLAFIFTQAPHGISAGREGLDAVFAAASYGGKISLFFIGDGVFQLLDGQSPEKILARDYIATFKLLPLYELEDYYLCADSMNERGLSMKDKWVIPAQTLDNNTINQRLRNIDHLLFF